MLVSNSAIAKLLVYGRTGPQGPSGAQGPTGSTGNRGPTGPTGERGSYFIGSNPSTQNTITLQLSSPIAGSTSNTLEINSSSLRGNTYVDQTPGLIQGTNVGAFISRGPLKNVDGGTFNFKGICAYGSLYASITGPNNEFISIDSIYYGNDIIGNYDPTTAVTGRLAYLGIPTQVWGAGITNAVNATSVTRGVTGGLQFRRTSFSATNDDTSFHLNAGANVSTVGPARRGALVGFTGGAVFSGAGSTTGIFLDANSAGAFVLKTPIGIRGISGNFSKNEISSITLFIDSDDVWSFPENVYFEPDENYLSCGANIIGLMTYDGGDNWYATVSHRGHNIENPDRQCIPGFLFGSCCYRNSDGTLKCLDYTDRSVCDRLFGTFNPATSCEQSCGADIGICCANGKCIENVSINLCQKFGGQYWPGVTCADYNPDGSNYPEGELSADELKARGRFCYDTCSSVKTVCCKNGQCLGNYTRVQCELILGGRSLTAASCEEADCCEYNTINGACCLCGEGTNACIGNVSPSECRAQGGVFMGPGKQCNEVSCGCVCTNEETGACCRPDEGGYCCRPYSIGPGSTGYTCSAATYLECTEGITDGPIGVWSPTLAQCQTTCGPGGRCSESPGSVNCCCYQIIEADNTACAFLSSAGCVPSSIYCRANSQEICFPTSDSACVPQFCWDVSGPDNENPGPDTGTGGTDTDGGTNSGPCGEFPNGSWEQFCCLNPQLPICGGGGGGGTDNGGTDDGGSTGPVDSGGTGSGPILGGGGGGFGGGFGL